MEQLDSVLISVRLTSRISFFFFVLSYLLSELLILAICITLFTCDPKNGVACHGVRYSSMVKHRDSKSNGVGHDSSWQLRFYFFDPHSRQHEYKTSLLKTLPFKKNLRHH